MGRPYPVSASTAVELALVGPTRTATVIATGPDALYLAVDDPGRTTMCLASARAVRVPCALVLDAKVPPPQLPAETLGQLGGGLLTIGEQAFRVSRWWRPPRPHGLGAAPPARLAGAVRWLTGRVADPLDPAGRDAVADLVGALTAGDRPDPAVARLLGRGPGLTPTGDDVLAGALVTLCALGAPAAGPLAAAVTSAAPDATTAVSAALLRHAARGECVPQLADLLEAIALGGADPASGTLPRAAGALLAVGHCSGAGLLHGVLVALAIAHRRLAQRVVASRSGSLSPAAAA
jgi:Protein of unknown function (DUF2877)